MVADLAVGPPSAGSACTVRTVEKKGKKTRAEVLRQTDKSVPDSSSPVLHEGLYFTATSGGIMTCYDPWSGERLWRERLNGAVLSSLIAGNGGIIVCTEEGEVVVVEAAREFHELSRSDLGEQIRATPAVSDGRVLVRTAAGLGGLESRTDAIRFHRESRPRSDP